MGSRAQKAEPFLPPRQARTCEARPASRASLYVSEKERSFVRAEPETRPLALRWAAVMHMYPIRLALVASILGTPFPTRAMPGSTQGGTTREEAIAPTGGEASMQRAGEASPSPVARP